MIVCAKKISKLYQQERFEVPALQEVSLEVAAGEFLAIAGTSGSGKTTFLNLIGCLDQPSSGELFIERTNISLCTEAELSLLRARKIGFIFQTFNLIPTLTAQENVEYPLLLIGESGTSRRKKAKDFLKRVGLEKETDRKPAALSGGQRQRVAIARAMVKCPLLVLADEPTASLDQKTAEEILGLMQELNAERGTTFIFSSHDPLVLKKAKRVFRLIDGKEEKELENVA